MTNRIYLAGIVEREGRILLIRQTPRSQWELPGGPLLQRHPDADLALAEIMTTFGITFPEPEERFLDTIYLPEGENHLVYNIYASSEWEGEPEIPIGMGAGWYALEELTAIDMREEVRRFIRVTFGLEEPQDESSAILRALAGDMPQPMQPPLAPLPDEPRATQAPLTVPVPPPAASVEDTAAEATEESADPSASVEEEAPADSELANEDSPADDAAAVTADSTAKSSEEDGGNENGEQASVEDPDSVDPGNDDSNVISFPAPATPRAESPAGNDKDHDEPISFPPASTAPEVVIDATRAPAAAPPGPDRRAAGYDVLRTLGRNDPEVGYQRLKAQYGELADDVVDFALGEVWNSGAIDRKQRSLVVVAMIAALGGKDGPLFSHINGALNHGASPDEIVDVMRTVAVYAGFPAALEAWGVMEDVFRQRRVTPSGRPQP